MDDSFVCDFCGLGFRVADFKQLREKVWQACVWGCCSFVLRCSIDPRPYAAGLWVQGVIVRKSYNDE